MEITSALMDRFFAGECDPEETARILAILAEHPELLEQFAGEQEWKDTALADTMPADVRQRIHSYVMQHTAKKKNRTPVKALQWMAAASIVLALAWTGWQLFLRPSAPSQPVVQNEIASTIPADTLVSNNGSQPMRVLLRDGSVILLSANASVQYQPAFAGRQRVIRLEGEAYFKVAKDPQRPFTVYSRGIATTALGTSFTIRAFENNPTVQVLLHTGKVVVRKMAADSSQVYLVPGDQLAVNVLTFHTTLTHSKPDPAAPVNESISEIPAATPSPLLFNRAPLAEVFKKLQQQYQTAILFDEAALSEMSFTGTLQPSETLEAVLGKIAFLNELIVTKTTEGYLIRVQQ